MKSYTDVFLSLKDRGLSRASSFISAGPAAVPYDVCYFSPHLWSVSQVFKTALVFFLSFKYFKSFTFFQVKSKDI